MLYKKTLGPVSANLISSLYELGKKIFTINDVVNITGLKSNAAMALTHNLIRRSIIGRLKYGKYIIIPQELGRENKYMGNWYVVAREIVNSPAYYISHYSALDIHNMVTQPITKVYVTTPKRERKKTRKVGNTSYEFIYTNENYIWGIMSYWVTTSEQVRVSDVERTLIDCLYRPKYCGGILEVAKGLWLQKEKIDYDKFFEYLTKFNKIVVIKRTGYILESLNLKDDRYLNKLRKKINNKYYLLDPLLTAEDTHRNTWKLIANISPQEMQKIVST